jgi:hypothetical protein
MNIGDQIVTSKPTARQFLRFLGRIAFGASVGLAIGFGAIALMVFGFEYDPSRRAGERLMAMMTIAGAFVGFSWGPRVSAREMSDALRLYFDSRGMMDRAWIAWAAVWLAAFSILIVVFGPFWRNSRYWDMERDGLATVFWLLCPIIGGFIVSRLVAWVMRGSR